MQTINNETAENRKRELLHQVVTESRAIGESLKDLTEFLRAESEGDSRRLSKIRKILSTASTDQMLSVLGADRTEALVDALWDARL